MQRLIKAHLSCLSHVLLAPNQDLALLANFSQMAENLDVSIDESVNGVRDLGLQGELLNQGLGLSEQPGIEDLRGTSPTTWGSRRPWWFASVAGGRTRLHQGRK